MTEDHKQIEQALGYTFKNRALLEKALTHRSYRFEEADVEVDNQRLEFLGDAALGLAAGAYLFSSYPDLNEGELTQLRSRLTSSRAISRIAKTFDLGSHLLLGRGEKQSGGDRRASNLTDAMEAIMGAAFLDSGMDAVVTIFHTLFVPVLESSLYDGWADNPKGYLQEMCQRKWKTSPRYRTIEEEGPPHSRVYTVAVVVNKREMGKGVGPNKRAAEMEAARHALEIIDWRDPVKDGKAAADDQ